MTDNGRMRGTITRLFPNKGFGFVRGDDGISRFMHCKDVDPPTHFDRMHEGQGVEFVASTTGPPDKGGGLRAIEVEIIG